MNKKYLSFFLLGLFVFSMFGTSLVSADIGDSVGNFLKDAVGAVKPVTGLLFGADRVADPDDGFVVLMAFLLTLLVVAGIITPTKIFGNNPGINWAIATIVALIGARFVPLGTLHSFTLGSEGLVGALFLIIPFIVVGTLILKSPTYMRKLLWIVYSVVMLALLLYNWNNQSNGEWVNFYWIHVAIIVVCVIAFSMDGTIQKFFRKAKYERLTSDMSATEKARITAKISDLETAKTAAATAGDTEEINRLDKKIKALKKLLT